MRRRPVIADVSFMTLREHAAYPGVRAALAITTEARGAWKNGTRVRKCVVEPGDFHPIGAMATVIGSVGPVDGEFGYFVRWDDAPGVPTLVRGRKVELAS